MSRMLAAKLSFSTDAASSSTWVRSVRYTGSPIFRSANHASRAVSITSAAWAASPPFFGLMVPYTLTA